MNFASKCMHGLSRSFISHAFFARLVFPSKLNALFQIPTRYTTIQFQRHMVMVGGVSMNR